MSWSKLDIFNLALNKLNKKSVNAFASAGEFADSGERGIDLLYSSEISGFPWRFATKVQQLSVLVDEPLLENWRYQLQLPSDYLAAVRTYPRVDFQIYQTVMYCNINDLILEYRYLPNYTALPSYFVRYFVILLASWYADSVANNDSLSKKLLDEADGARGQALFVDSQSHPTPSIISAPLLSVRNGGWYEGCDNTGCGRY